MIWQTTAAFGLDDGAEAVRSDSFALGGLCWTFRIRPLRPLTRTDRALLCQGSPGHRLPGALLENTRLMHHDLVPVLCQFRAMNTAGNWIGPGGCRSKWSRIDVKIG